MDDILILASSSPRRIKLLTDCKIHFKAIDHTLDESSVTNKDPVKLAKLLAFNKANSIAEKREFRNKNIIGVDTLVVFKNQILGKPKDKLEAEKFLKLLSDKTHKVISGVSLINIEKSIKLIKSSISYVKFIKIDELLIKYYLDNNLWEGYAGGYAIQEGIFDLIVKKIKGSYTNIVGLPVNVLYNMLKDINFKFIW